MNGFEFHHVGVGVLDLPRAIHTYEALGHRLHGCVEDPGINIRVAFLRSPGSGPWIELLAPLAAQGPLESLIRRKLLPSPYHTCYAVPELEPAGAALTQLEFLQVGPACAAVAFGGARVAFFYSTRVGLFELVERPPLWP